MRRLFKGLKQAPSPSYDAVVIGAGIGGLVTANLLARQGLRVLLVEQHYMVGGYCSTFRRGAYTFDAATHFYPLLGNPETLTGRLLVELGVQTGWVAMDPVDTFHFPDGSRFEVPQRLETYLGKLKAEFPEEAAALDGFFTEVREAYLLGLLHYFRGRPTAPGDRFDRYRQRTLGQALEHWFRSPKLRLLLTADCPHWGSPPSRISFVFDSMLRLSYFLGNYYPQGGSQAFADELARCFEEQGGELLLSTAATRILVEDGRVRGVELEARLPSSRRYFERLKVRSPVVVSNADLRLTLERLLPPEHVDEALRERVREQRTSFPCWLTHLGLQGIAAEELERVQGYYWDSYDTDRVGKDALRFKLFAPTVYEPAMAPPGGQVLIVQKVLDLDYEAIADWPAHKAEVERFIFHHLERVLPGIERHIVVRSSASARTSHHFTWNLRGAMLGWEMSPDQLGQDRADLEASVEGLFYVGHWTRPGGGITPVIISAQQAAAAILAGRGGSRLIDRVESSASGRPLGQPDAPI